MCWNIKIFSGGIKNLKFYKNQVSIIGVLRINKKIVRVAYVHTSPMVNPNCLARIIISIWKIYPLETQASTSFPNTSFLYNLKWDIKPSDIRIISKDTIKMPARFSDKNCL